MEQIKAPRPFPVSERLLRGCAASRSLAGVRPLRSPDDFKQFSRVTVTVDDATDAQALTTGNPALLRFDLVAASPRSLSGFLHLCKQAEIDIISLDFSHRLNFHIDQKHVSNDTQQLYARRGEMLILYSCINVYVCVCVCVWMRRLPPRLSEGSYSRLPILRSSRRQPLGGR
jgi:hypothetical protein